MPRAPRHDRDAGGPAEVLAAKAGLRQQVWAGMRAAKVAGPAAARGPLRPSTGPDLTDEKIAAIPLLSALRGTG